MQIVNYGEIFQVLVLKMQESRRESIIGWGLWWLLHKGPGM